MSGETNLFQLGKFTLASGNTTKWKIECDSLTDKDVQALAMMVGELVGGYSEVHGVPRGGLRLAEALQVYVGLAGPILLVDDVLTTGGSMERYRDSLAQAVSNPKEVRFVGAVLFARGPCPSWVRAVFQMPCSLWLPGIQVTR